MFRNRLPRYEILSADAMDVLEGGWRRLIAEVGVRFDHPDALARFRAAGQDVGDDGVVRFDPDFVLEQVALAPKEYTVRGRNPEQAFTLGGDHMVFASIQGPPFVRMGDERRNGSFADVERFLKLGQVFDEIDTPGSSPVEADDRPIDSRHLDMQLAALTLTDKPHMGAMFTGAKAADGLEMGAIVAGGRAALEREPFMWGVDQRQLPAVLRGADAGRAAALRRGPPARDDHAVPADGRDVAGDDPGDAGAADDGAAGRRRLRPARQPRGRRSCSARSSRTPTCSRARRASAGRSRPSAC